MKEHNDIFICPVCRGDLGINHDQLSCKTCGTRYQVEDGIPLLFRSSELDNSRKDVTDIVKEFYEQSPFPDYENFESIGELVQKAQDTFFANLLNQQIPFNIKVLEVGCGTGQMSNFLGISQRYIFGTDMSLNSLKLGQDFKVRNNLEKVGFYQMNLFRPIFKEESFPLVICNGVLHHTGDPLGGFQSISKLVKKGGYILVGLYNKYGRLATDLRRTIFNITGDRFKYLDPRLRRQDRGETKKDSWFKDQYRNPHESKHTIREVLDWFDKTGFSFVYGIPNPKAFEPFRLDDAIFRTHAGGSWLDHFVTQFHLMLRGSQEGGLFIMIGKRNA